MNHFTIEKSQSSGSTGTDLLEDQEVHAPLARRRGMAACRLRDHARTALGMALAVGVYLCGWATMAPV